MSDEIVKLVCVGPCTLDGNKPWIDYAIVTDEQIESGTPIAELPTVQHVFFAAKACKTSDAVGGIYAVTRTPKPEGGYGWSIRSARYVRAWPVLADRLQWAEQERAIAIHDEEEKRKKKASEQDPIAQACAPLRQLFRDTPGFRKRQLLAAIVYEITK